MSNLAGQRIKDTYDGVLHASGSSLTLGDGNSTNTIDANFNTVDVSAGGLKEGGVSHASVSATTSVAGHVELATNAEAHAATDTTRAVTPSNLLIKKDGTAFVAGDFSGNSRGSNALDVQSGRSSVTEVASGGQSSALGYDNTASGFSSSAFGYQNTASGYYASAVGYRNTASGGLFSSGFGCYSNASQSYSSAFGYQNEASATRSSAVGYSNEASGSSSSAFGYDNRAFGASSSAFGYYNNAAAFKSCAIGYLNEAFGDISSAFGYSNYANGNYSSAFGYNNTAGGSGSSAIGKGNNASGTSSSTFGHYTKTTVNNTFEAGYWSNGSTRVGAIRIHPNGQVAMTIEDSASAPTDGGATAGSEPDGTLARGMFAIQKNGTAVTLYYNNGGSIQSLSLGTLS